MRTLILATWLAPTLAALLLGCGSSDGVSDGNVVEDAATSLPKNDLAGVDLAGVDLAGVDLAGVDLSAAPVVGEPSNLNGITAAHNMARANAMPVPSPALSPLTWDATLATAAQSWANGCKFEHSMGQYGENLYASAGFTPIGAAVVKDWVDEVMDYNYANNSCSATCGHYTQVVWRSTARLGCALKACSQNSPFGSFPNWTLVVCEYDPPGNFNGKKPY